MEDKLADLRDGFKIDGKEYNIDEIKSVVDSIRGLLAMAYGKRNNKAQQIMNDIKSLIMSPIKGILQSSINLLRDFEEEVIDEVEDWMGVLLETNPDNMNRGQFFHNMLQCYTLESLADFIFDEIEAFFDKIENFLLDLYKSVYQYLDFLDKDIVVLGKKKWIKDTYNILTKLSETLGWLEEKDLSQGMEEFIKNWLKDNGYATVYNPKTGEFEEIDISQCLDPVESDGKSKSGLPTSPDKVSGMTLSDDKDYKDFMNNKGKVNITCDFNLDEEQIKRKTKEKAQNIDKVKDDAIKQASQMVD